MALNVSALDQFTQENADELNSKKVIGHEMLKDAFFHHEKGVKDRKKINYFTDSALYQMGKCVKTASGTTSFTQKYITVEQFTNKTEDCLSDFEGKYLEANLPVGSTYSEADYPQIVADAIALTQAKHIAQALWRGGIENIAGNGLSNQIQGWLYLLKNTYSSEVKKPSFYSGTTAPTASNAEAIFLDMVANTHEDLVGAELVLRAPTTFYTALKLNCHTAYGFNFSSSDPDSFAHPVHGNITIKRDPMMGATKNAVLTVAKNLVYGYDGVSEEDYLEIKADPVVKNLIHKTSVFKAGAEVIFPDYCTIYSWA